MQFHVWVGLTVWQPLCLANQLA